MIRVVINDSIKIVSNYFVVGALTHCARGGDPVGPKISFFAFPVKRGKKCHLLFCNYLNIRYTQAFGKKKNEIGSFQVISINFSIRPITQRDKNCFGRHFETGYFLLKTSKGSIDSQRRCLSSSRPLLSRIRYF